MSWVDTRLKYLCVDSGQYGLNVAADNYVAEGMRLIRTSDITTDGSLRPDEEGVFVDIPVEPRHQLHHGDILLSRSGTLGRSFMVPAAAQGQTFAGFLIRFRPRPGIVPRFLYYATQSKQFQGVIHSEAVSSTIQNFNAERYANISLRVPDSEEQQRIADFLDAQTALIGRLSSRMKAQDDLLALRRRSVMARAWMADAPSVRLGYFLLLVTSGPRGWGEYVSDDGKLFFRSANLRRDSINPNLASVVRVTPPENAVAESVRSTVYVDDVLVGITGANTGWVTHADERVAGASVSQHVCLLRPSSAAINGTWLAYLLSSPKVQDELLGSQYGGTKTQLSLPDLRDLRVPIPSLEDQSVLCRSIDSELAQIEGERVLRKRQIALLAERRQALITAAVTGQFDVTAARRITTA
ncbi:MULTISPECIES: restriction endonuclease subunit S [Streptomyces]|uniref:Restriction endonuclease subunit S n=1 Tax=Streptomyces griseoloalbus TaxID=67303 RepID=A0ABV3E0H0_9ACTN